MVSDLGDADVSLPNQGRLAIPDRLFLKAGTGNRWDACLNSQRGFVDCAGYRIISSTPTRCRRDLPRVSVLALALHGTQTLWNDRRRIHSHKGRLDLRMHLVIA